MFSAECCIHSSKISPVGYEGTSPWNVVYQQGKNLLLGYVDVHNLFAKCDVMGNGQDQALNHFSQRDFPDLGQDQALAKS